MSRETGIESLDSGVLLLTMNRPDRKNAFNQQMWLEARDALVEAQGDDRVRVVFLTMHQEVAYARRAIEAGASGYVLKHAAPDELVTAIHAALEGKTYLTPSVAGEVLRDIKSDPKRAHDPVALLTPRQREILQLLAEGKSAKEIGAVLDISARTVEFHKYQMMDRLELHTSAELVHFAIRHGIVEI